MSAASENESFMEWNERILLENDPESYLNNSRRVVRWIEQRRINAVLKLLNARPADCVLEIGCGPGSVLRKVNAKRKYGVEISPAMLDRARETAAAAVLTRANAEELPYTSAAFERVFCTSVLSHVRNPRRVLCEAYRVLKPSGRLVISVSNLSAITAGIALARWLNIERFVVPQNQNDRVFLRDYHIHDFNWKELQSIISVLPPPALIQALPNRIFPVHFLALWEKV